MTAPWGVYEVFQARSDGSEAERILAGLHDMGQTVIGSPDGERAIADDRSEGHFYLAEPSGAFCPAWRPWTARRLVGLCGIMSPK